MSEYLDDISQAGGNTISYWMETWVHNATVNREIIRRGLKSGRMGEMGQHPKVVAAPAYIVCSGPSLDSTPWDLLRQVQHDDHAGVFAATSNVGVPLAHGLTPDYVTVVDANQTLYSQVEDLLDLLGKTDLLASPLTEPRLLSKWPSRVWVFRPLQFGDTFIQSVLPKMYSTRHDLDATHRVFIDWLTVQFLNAGCVTNAMVLAASFLGYDPIIMLGNDLGFPDGRMRCTTYTRKAGTFTPEPTPPLVTRELLRTATNGVRTISEYLHYKLNLFIAWRLTPCKLWNTATAGIIHVDEIPQVDVTESILKWRDLATYPIDVGSKAWHTHVQNITLRMGMKMVSIPQGYQITPISQESVGVHPATVVTVPSTGVVSTATPALPAPPTPHSQEVLHV